MSRSITQEIITTLENNEISSFHLLEFDIGGTTYKITDCDIPITTGTENLFPTDFDHIDWGKQGPVVTTPDATTAPDGSLTGVKVDESDTFAQFMLFNEIDTFNDNEIVTISAYVKAAERDLFFIMLRPKNDIWPSVHFNLTTGTITHDDEGVGFIDTGIESVGNGWYRVWMTRSVGSGANTPVIYYGIKIDTSYPHDPEGNVNYNGTAGEGLYIWGPKLTIPSTYQSRGFTFDNVNYSSNNIVDSMNIRMDNLDRVLTSLFIGNVVKEEVCKLYVILFDSDNVEINHQLIFNGLINEFTIDEAELQMTVTSIFTKWDQQSIPRHSALCRWKKFKGSECLYAGSETTCDRTYSRCLVLENTDNYGGFRWLPSIEDLIIWWGPVPSERRAELNK